MDERPYHVLECSKIETPAAFWSLYVEQVVPEGSAGFGHNLDAFWDALSAGGPGFPGASILEVRNVETLEANGHGPFVSVLEKIAQDLRPRGLGVELLVLRFPAPPRGRLYQHAQFVSRELEGCVVERVIGWQPTPETCEMLWVKPAGRLWQRFFLDVGVTFWEEWSADDTFEDFEDLEPEHLIELGLTQQLAGKTLGTAQAQCGPSNCGFHLHFLDGAQLRLHPASPGDLDSDTQLSIVPPHEGEPSRVTRT